MRSVLEEVLKVPENPDDKFYSNELQKVVDYLVDELIEITTHPDKPYEDLRPNVQLFVRMNETLLIRLIWEAISFVYPK